MNTPNLARAVIARARAEGITFIQPSWVQRSFSCSYVAASLALEELTSSCDVGRYQRGRGHPVTAPPKEPTVPTHIDDWIEQPPTSEGERLAKDWLDEFRKPAHSADHVWLESVALTCLYEGERYRCVGASRMGDVWLSPNLKSPIGYEVRADVNDCSAWERSDAGRPRTARACPPWMTAMLREVDRELDALLDFAELPGAAVEERRRAETLRSLMRRLLGDAPIDERPAEGIPISAALRLAEDHGYEQIIVIGRHTGPEGHEHVTTYGVDGVHCRIAALCGDALKRFMGWPEGELSQHTTRHEELLRLGRDLIAYYDDKEGAPNVFDSIDRLRTVVTAAGASRGA